MTRSSQPRLRPVALALGAVALMALPVLAHSDVDNPTVQARMSLMEDIRNEMGTLAGMMRGRVDFDAATAEAARAELERLAADIPAKFEANETHPESESAPAIWEDWAGFSADAEALEVAAAAVDTTSLDSLRGSFGPVGQACGACHQSYRVEK